MFCHGTQTMHVALQQCLSARTATQARDKLYTQIMNWKSAIYKHVCACLTEQPAFTVRVMVIVQLRGGYVHFNFICLCSQSLTHWCYSLAVALHSCPPLAVMAHGPQCSIQPREIFECIHLVCGWSKQTSKHTHARVQCSHARVGLTQARPNYGQKCQFQAP